MKKPVLYLILILFACSPPKNATSDEAAAGSLPTGDNSRTSLDWPGIYRGILPCADCDGLLMEIQLSSDETFMLSRRYLGKADDASFKTEGTFRWDESGGRITLYENNQPVNTEQFLVGENKLIKLDSDGKPITGDLSSFYVLNRTGQDGLITEKYWKLIELNGKPITSVAGQPHEPYFILKLQERRVNGNGGCNTFFGTYEMTEGWQIRFSKMGSTMMACADVAYERDFLAVFNAADNYTVKSDTLSLNKARMAPLARFVAVYLR
jgi:copper homeostasis protein (lipoprotein)